MIPLNKNPLSAKKAEEWLLVLEAMSIQYQLKTNANQWDILVSEPQYQEAVTQIKLYRSEKIAKREMRFLQDADSQSRYAIFVPFFLYLFFILVNLTDSEFKWVQNGSANAQEIMSGQWWRAITALTLHADAGHLFSNLLFGSITATLLIRQTGSGLGWFMILCAGFLGDMANALLFQKNHISIGASTAVFGIIGILSSLQFHKNYRLKKWKAWIPFASGLSMLAFFGTEGKNTDITAHLFGFIAGLLLGFLGGAILRGKYYQGLIQAIFGLASGAMTVFAWILALR